MKKIITLVSLLFLFIACNDQTISNSSNSTMTGSHTEVNSTIINNKD